MAKIKVGINGFGRIGRLAFRASFLRNDIEVVSINDLIDVEYMAYMLRYDTIHGGFKGTVTVKDGKLVVNGNPIRVTAEKDPANLKWDTVGAEYVIESTGLFLSRDKAEAHLKAGAKRVILSAPSKDDTPMFVYGVNHKAYKKEMDIIYPDQNARIYIPVELDGRRGKTVFTAAHSNPEAKIYWHLDDSYIGITTRFHQLGLDPAPGRHRITVTDEKGESVTRWFTIMEN